MVPDQATDQVLVDRLGESGVRHGHGRAHGHAGADAAERQELHREGGGDEGDAEVGVTLLGLDELLAESDFVTIHMPKTPETTGMISDAQLALMKPSAFIVNVARGGLIDEERVGDVSHERSTQQPTCRRRRW